MSERNHEADATACESKLGKEPPPPIPEERNVIVISENIAERLRTGNADANRVENYENYWIEKLACIDESHTVRNKIDIVEAEETLNRLAEYVIQSEKPKFTCQEAIKLKDCFAVSRGETLRCGEDVERFVQQVDRSMYDAVRKTGQLFPTSDKKISYAERFKRAYDAS